MQTFALLVTVSLGLSALPCAAAPSVPASGPALAEGEWTRSQHPALLPPHVTPTAPGMHDEARFAERSPEPASIPPLRAVEPSDGGKSLDRWLRDMDMMPASPAMELAEAAVRHMGTDALPGLLWRLQGGSQEANHALTALNALGDLARPAVPSLIKIWERRSGANGLAAEVLVALRVDGPVVAALADPERREAALYALYNPRTSEDAVGPLAPLLTNADPEVRLRAVEDLGQVRRQPRLAVPALLAVFNDPVPAVRLAVFNDPVPAVRQAARAALEDLGLPPETLVDIFLRSITDLNASVRQATCEELGAVCRARREESGPAVDALVRRLTDREPGVRVSATRALGEIGPSGVTPDLAVVRALRARLRDPDKYVRTAAAKVLVRFPTEPQNP